MKMMLRRAMIWPCLPDDGNIGPAAVLDMIESKTQTSQLRERATTRKLYSRSYS